MQVSITLSLNQIIRSGIPVFTALLGVLVEKKVPSRIELIGIVVLTAGVVTCLYEGSSINGSLRGILLCLASTLCGAGMLSFSGAILDQTEKMDPIRLNFYCAPVSVAVRSQSTNASIEDVSEDTTACSGPDQSDCNQVSQCPCQAFR